jgi:pyruvate dehydrogenase E1 component alpha subunit
MVMFIENNQWAISIPREAQTRSETIAQKAVAYGFDGIQVDGNDILAVYVATKEAVEKAKAGGGPTLIEAVTYRLSVHTTADDPKKYRSDEEVARWEKLDPIPRFRNYLVSKKILNDKLIEEIEQDALAVVAKGVEAYDARREVDPLDVFKYLYAEMPQELIEQREEYRIALEREGMKSNH